MWVLGTFTNRRLSNPKETNEDTEKIIRLSKIDKKEKSILQIQISKGYRQNRTLVETEIRIKNLDTSFVLQSTKFPNKFGK